MNLREIRQKRNGALGGRNAILIQVARVGFTEVICKPRLGRSKRIGPVTPEVDHSRQRNKKVQRP